MCAILCRKFIPWSLLDGLCGERKQIHYPEWLSDIDNHNHNVFVDQIPLLIVNNGLYLKFTNDPISAGIEILRNSLHARFSQGSSSSPVDLLTSSLLSIFY